MKFSTILPVAFLGLAIAAPVAEPQDIDFDAYNAIPIESDISAPVGVADEAVVSTSYAPTAAASAAIAAATGDTDPDLTKVKKRTDCSPAAAGNFATASPDTDIGFLNHAAFSKAALSAVAPPGYFLAAGFQNLDAAAQNPSYKTYVSSSLTAYDPAQCAPLCNAMTGCNSFNIYFERDPSLENLDDTCSSPASVTRIKCSFFGSAISIADAGNVGQYQASFHVVIAGSNVYTLTPQPLPNFTGPVSLGNAAISSPTADGTYMGVQAFAQSQPYDPSVCAAACTEKSAYNTRHAAAGVAPRLCVFFDAYILYKNGANGVFTCTYYTEAYGPAYATNVGQYDGSGNHYTIGHSYSYTVASAAVAPK